MNYSQSNAAAAIALLAHASEQDEALLPAMSGETSTTDVIRRARIVRHLVNMRAMMQETRRRSAEWKSAVERFKAKQTRIAKAG